MQLNIVHEIFTSLKQNLAQICRFVFISVGRGMSSLFF